MVVENLKFEVEDESKITRKENIDKQITAEKAAVMEKMKHKLAKRISKGTWARLSRDEIARKIQKKFDKAETKIRKFKKKVTKRQRDIRNEIAKQLEKELAKI